MNIGKGGTHNSTTLIEVYKYLLNIFFNKLTRAQKKVKVLKKKGTIFISRWYFYAHFLYTKLLLKRLLSFAY